MGFECINMHSQFPLLVNMTVVFHHWINIPNVAEVSLACFSTGLLLSWLLLHIFRKEGKSVAITFTNSFNTTENV
ncbi:hypothetical protein XELAEV_18001934mg [Xenopus laevis]|nr:hypothetical protein XELAEV_18001934mg [Xenopus laevis]